MAVFRVERNKGYTVMSNHHLRNKELSLKAKGLLSQMLSLPEDWDYTLKGLPYDFGNFLDVVGRPLQQALGVDHAQGEDVLGRGHTCVLFEIVYKPVGADVQGFRIIVYADLCVIVLVEVSRRAFNLLLDVAGGFFLFMLLAVHQQQNIVEQRCNIVLVPIAAQLHS